LQSSLHKLQKAEERLRLDTKHVPLDNYPSFQEGIPLSLMASIKLSDEMLDDPSKNALGTLSLFPPKPNTFSELAALSVCAVNEKTLDNLWDSGLLETFGFERYTLHQTISDYAGLKLIDNDTYKRMVDFFVTFLNKFREDFLEIDLEFSNILAALEIAFERKMDAIPNFV
jgi:hypothetical protein